MIYIHRNIHVLKQYKCKTSLVSVRTRVELGQLLSDVKVTGSILRCYHR